MSNTSSVLPSVKPAISGMAALTAMCLLLVPLGVSAAEDSPQAAAAETVEGVIAVEHEYAQAYVNSDADALGRLLADDWEVVSGFGAWGEEKGTREDIVEGVRSHQWTHTFMDVSDIKVRLYGNVAVATEHLTVSGVLAGKPFNDIKETESDIFVWSDGGWKCVLTHETVIRK
jgi:ketosteroid isomerase-like protein